MHKYRMMSINKYLVVFAVIASLLLASCTNNKGFVGYATSFIDGSGQVHISTSGFSNKEAEKPYDKNTIQPIGSVSKTVVGLALMKAVDQGLLDLDKDVNDYLDFKLRNPHLDSTNTFTLRQLSNHTSGILDDEALYESAYAFQVTPTEPLGDFLKSVLSKEGKRYAPSHFHSTRSGLRYSYSNFGAALAAYIIERASGQPFDLYTEEHIFHPLGMQNTGWFYKDIDTSFHAVLYDEKGTALRPYSCVTYPDGSLKTTISDLSLLLKAFIKGYSGSSTLLTQSSWKELFKKSFIDDSPVENINPKEPNSGVFIFYFKSGKIGHTGSDLGACSFMMFDPKTSTGHIFMANEDLTDDNIDTFKSIWSNIK